MSFKATLEVDGESYRVLECSYDLERDTDQFGKPASDVRGGKVYLRIESSGDSSFFEWMVSSYTRKAGKVIFNKTEEDAELKVLEFEDAYMVGYREDFGSQGSTGMVESLTISAKKIVMGGAEHENSWPS
ncbi:MAG: type VI secretion system tube protein TssD [Bacteroidota bacterium]